MGKQTIPASMPYNERDTATGRFTASFSREDVISALEQADDGTTSEVADIAGCAYRTAYEYLTRLESDGRVSRRKLGTTSVWELTGEPDT